MKKFTNYSPGLRGINTKDGMVWIEAGKSVSIDPKNILGDVPDLGAKPAATADADAEAEDLKARVDELTKQVETLTKERDDAVKDKAELEKQVETLTKPKA